MQTSDSYMDDLLLYFHGKPFEFSLYRQLVRRMDESLPGMSARVQKSQVSFYNRHLFATASLPVRRKKDWPAACLLVTFGLEAKLDSPRIAVAVQPYPNRWTHHVVLTDESQVDDELLGWMRQAYDFSQSKR